MHLAAASDTSALQRTAPPSLNSALGAKKGGAVHSAIANTIQEMVDLETEGLDTKNPELFLSMIHPDMAWPFPPTADSHDRIDWVWVMGRFDKERWRLDWQGLFDTHELIRNRRIPVKIEISKEEDAAFAVVDRRTHEWSGRASLAAHPHVGQPRTCRWM